MECYVEVVFSGDRLDDGSGGCGKRRGSTTRTNWRDVTQVEWMLDCLIAGIPACTSVSSRSSRALRKVFARLIGKGLVRDQVCAEREGGGI